MLAHVNRTESVRNQRLQADIEQLQSKWNAAGISFSRVEGTSYSFGSSSGKASIDGAFYQDVFVSTLFPSNAPRVSCDLIHGTATNAENQFRIEFRSTANGLCRIIVARIGTNGVRTGTGWGDSVTVFPVALLISLS